MIAEDIRSRELDDLKREIAALQKDTWNLRFRQGSEKAGDPSKIRSQRRDVARIMTVIRERELGIARGSKKARGTTKA